MHVGLRMRFTNFPCADVPSIMAGLKVLVEYSDCKRVVSLSDERKDTLLSAAKLAFKDYLKECDRVAIDFKDEDWGGEFVDFQDNTVKDRSVFRLRLLPQVHILCLVLFQY